MNKSFNYEVNKILKNAELEMLELHHPYVGTEHLLLSLLKNKRISNITSKYNLTYERFRHNLIEIVGSAKKQSEVILYTPLLKLVIDTSLVLAKEDDEELNEIHLMNALLTSDDGIALRILMSLNINIDQLYKEFSNNSLDTLNEIGVNLNQKKSNDLIGREKEINNMIEILLRKNKNNPILIGNCGVGKSAIVYELAKRIDAGLVPPRLQDMRVISLDMASMLSNTKYRGEFETRLNNIIKEVMNNKNIILFIDEIHTIVKSGGGDGSIDAANILKPYLAYDDIKIIGATTINEYDKYIFKDKALSRRFEKVLVNEPNTQETIHILKGIKHSYEEHHGVKISDENIADIVQCANKYIFTNHNPDKSLDVLDYVCSRVTLSNYDYQLESVCDELIVKQDYKKALKLKRNLKKNKEICITKEDIMSVIESMTNIKIMDETSYNNLCRSLDKAIIGQNLEDLKNILKQKLHASKILGIMINGEEHVGKSYTAQVISQSLGYNLVELNMLEYTSDTAINKLMGSDPGYVGYEDENVFDKIKYNPYSLLLLKNFENASVKIKNIFKTILETGKIKNNRGEIIDFNNTIIIMTTNIKDVSIGYNHTNRNAFVDNIIEYQLIAKESVKEYLKEYKISDIKLRSMKEKINFKEINKLIQENVEKEIEAVI